MATREEFLQRICEEARAASERSKGCGDPDLARVHVMITDGCNYTEEIETAMRRWPGISFLVREVSMSGRGPEQRQKASG